MGKGKIATKATPVAAPITVKTTIKKPKKRSSTDYYSFILKLSKTINPDISISATALDVYNNIVLHLIDEIAKGASSLAEQKKTKTLTSDNITSYVALKFPPELLKIVQNKSNIACEKYLLSKNK